MEKIITKLDDVKIGDFVKFSEKDGKSKITYIGKVVSLEHKYITFDCPHGLMGFKIHKDNELYLTDEKPTGWDKFEKDPDKYKKSMKDKEAQKDFAPPVKTLKELVLDVVKENKKLTKPKLFSLLKNTFNEIDEGTLRTNMELALLKI